MNDIVIGKELRDALASGSNVVSNPLSQLSPQTLSQCPMSA